MSELKFMNEKFKCPHPHCNTMAKQEWVHSSMLSEIVMSIYHQYYLEYRQGISGNDQRAINTFLKTIETKFPKRFNSYFPSQLAISKCHSCEDFSLWVNKEIVYPKQSLIDPPNEDMNPDIQELYIEAGNIVIDSPKGAAALLRLALQKLLIQLGETDKNINQNITNLVAKGLDPEMQQALDFVRVVGNEAVHPGEINLNDNKEIAIKLFNILNFIAYRMISIPKELNKMYNEIIPDDKKKQINARDGRKLNKHSFSGEP
jgi:hypothetical protein